MTNPEIPDRARAAALAALHDDDMWHRPDSGGVWRASYERAVELVLEAALPHLRVQETPRHDCIADDNIGCLACEVENEDADPETEDDVERRDSWYRLAVERGEGDEFIAMLAHERRLPATRTERSATPHPRPVVDREALAVGIRAHTLFPADPVEPVHTCACGWKAEGPFEYSQHARHVADAVLALLPTEEGEGSEVYFCPASGEMEIHPGGGFDTCCDRPQDHQTDIKWLTKLCHRLGKAEGRKEAGEEISAALMRENDLLESLPKDEPAVNPVARSAVIQRSSAFRDSAMIARDLTSQPSGAAPTSRTAPDGHTDLPEDPEGREIDDEDRADLAEILGAGMTSRLLEGLPGDGE